MNDCMLISLNEAVDLVAWYFYVYHPSFNIDLTYKNSLL